MVGGLLPPFDIRRSRRQGGGKPTALAGEHAVDRGIPIGTRLACDPLELKAEPLQKPPGWLVLDGSGGPEAAATELDKRVGKNGAERAAAGPARADRIDRTLDRRPVVGVKDHRGD